MRLFALPEDQIFATLGGQIYPDPLDWFDIGKRNCNSNTERVSCLQENFSKMCWSASSEFRGSTPKSVASS